MLFNSSRKKQPQHTGDAKLFPLSHSQQAMWLLYQRAPQSSAYNIYMAVRIGSELDLGAWHRAWQHIVERHQALRTTYTERDGQPVQVVHPYQEVDVLVTDASSWSDDYLNKQVLEEAECPYNLETGPVLRVHLFTRSAIEHIQLLAMHHIAGDMWSFDILLSELQVLYAAEVKTLPQAALEVVENSFISNSQTDNILPLPTLSYTDYVRWQTEMLASSKGAQLSAYWLKQLAGELPLLDLPVDKPRPREQTYRRATHIISLDEELLLLLRPLSESERTSLYRILFAALFVLLYRLSGQEDILVSSPMAGREEFKGIIGYFTNPVVCRANLAGNPTFQEFLAQVSCTVSEAKEHQDYPFPLLVKQLSPDPAPSRHPLFQVSLTWQKHRWYDQAQKSPLEQEKTLLVMSPYLIEGHQRGAEFDLDLAVIEAGSEFQQCWQYNTDLFDASTVARMAGNYQTLLKSILTNPEERVSALPLLTQAERHQLLVEWNNTTQEYPLDLCIHQLFEAQVERSPNAIAVVFEEEQLTYRELNQRANKIAHYLRTLGVGPEVLVGICVWRSPLMVVGLLGILKAGGAYVPLDPAYPSSRIDYLLNDSQLSVLLTQQKLVTSLPEHQARVVCLDADWEEISVMPELPAISGVTPENLAYVIYTSGSTGKPKGVLIAHRGLCNLATAQIKLFDVQPDNRVLQFASLSFDASISEIVMAVCAGATLCLGTSESLQPGQPLLRLLHEQRITHVTLVPSALAALPTQELPVLQNIVVAGESCPTNVVASWVKGRRFFNAYGPTESTVCATVAQCFEGTQVPPIGRPIDNTLLYILDRYLQPVGVGVAGDLYIGGQGLARGYLNRPDLTSEKFIPNPFNNQPGERLYKTGDKARYLPNGNIEFLGRVDNQVKLRGFRIELGEIETVLKQHPEVLETVVVVSQNVTDHKYLVAYIVLKNSKVISRSDLRSFLFDKLPDYMIPGVFIMLDALPLTPNGKVDRRSLHEDAEKMALKESEIEQFNLKINIPDRNKQEETGLKNTRSDNISSTLRSLIAKLLHIEIEEIEISATFLELGMDSLLLLEAMRILETTFGVQVEAQQLFEELETIDALTTYIDQNMPLEPSEKNSDENELYPISVKTDLNFTKTSLRLDKTKALNAPLNAPKDKEMNKPNKDREQQTNIEKIIAQQLQLMSQQLELLRNEQLQKERSSQAENSENPSWAELSYGPQTTVTRCPV